MIFFHVSDSNHIQGAALMTSMATYQEQMDVKGKNDCFCYRVKVEWYRTTELPVGNAIKASPNLLIPTSQTQLCEDMNTKTGEAWIFDVQSLKRHCGLSCLDQASFLVAILKLWMNALEGVYLDFLNT
jgi:hypothetical protein